THTPLTSTTISTRRAISSSTRTTRTMAPTRWRRTSVKKPPENREMAKVPTNAQKTPAGGKAATLPSPEEYAEFIRGIELLDVRLVSSAAHSDVHRPEASELKLLVKYGSDMARVDSAVGYAFEA